MFWLWVLGIILQPLATAKSTQGEFRLSYNDNFHYLTKFGCGIGQCTYKFKLRVHPRDKVKRKVSVQPNMRIAIFLDEQWDSADFRRSADKCTQLDSLRAQRRVTLPLNGDWSAPLEGVVTQQMRPHIWYFVAEDCDSHVLGVYVNSTASVKKKKYESFRIQWEGELKYEESHFSYELSSTFRTNVIHLVCYLVTFGSFLYRQYHVMKRAGGLHLLVQALNVALILDVLGCVLQLVHSGVYAENGKGVALFDAFSGALNIIAQVVVGALLLCISFGYTLSTQELPSQKVVVPTLFFVATLHVVLVR
eukprot:Polyplicarium_translucidae@DN3046_c0_g1_i1.p1